MFVSPSTIAVSRQKNVGSAMLGTGDVAIIYHHQQHRGRRVAGGSE
jgi:hypothetical protein